jgi:hypothetical protein
MSVRTGVSRKEKENDRRKILTEHPLGKSGKNIDRKKYDTLKKAILSALRKMTSRTPNCSAALIRA